MVYKLEIYIGSIVVWKHGLDIGNIKRRLETSSVYWKHKFYIGNNLFGNIKMIMKIMYTRIRVQLGFGCN